MARPLYLAELVAYDPAAGAITTLRYASGTGFLTRPAESPASTYYDGRLQQPLNVKRYCFARGATAGRPEARTGELVLLNGDGALDGLLAYGFSGRAVTIRRGVAGAAYPSGFKEIFVGTMEQPVVQGDTLVIRIRDRQRDLEVPLQTTKYAGTNTLPDGLEGVAGDLKGKPKPVCYGVVQNVPAVCVNTAKLIYQVHDGAVQSIDAVYDRGLRLGENLDSWGSGASLGMGTDYLNGLAAGFITTSLTELAVAVGNNGKVAVSSNGGSSWSIDGATGFGATNLFCAAFGPVPVSVPGYIIAGAGGAMRYFTSVGSPTSVTSGFGADTIRALCYAAQAGVWVAVGDAGKISTSSDNGATWTARSSGVATALYGVAAGNGIIVAVGASGVVLTSADGITWSSRTGGFSTSDLFGVVFGGDRFVAVGAGEKANVSLNGTSWPTAVTVGLANYASGGSVILRAVTWDAGLFVAVGDDESIATSPNGFDWTVRKRTASSTTEIVAVTRYPSAGKWFAGYQDSGLPGSGIYQPPAIGTYANLTDLQDDTKAPAPGTIKTYVAGGYFRLGSRPTGTITADVTQGAAASNRTAGQLFALLLQRAGKTTGDWSAADVTALDAAVSAVLGYWTAEETTVAEALDLVAASVWAWWGADRFGVYRIRQFAAPRGRPVLELGANDLLRPPRRLVPSDAAGGLPTWRTILRYARNYSVQPSDVAFGVSDARRTFLAAEWREAKAEDASVQTAHLLAGQTAEESLLSSAADAATEASRRQALRGRLRHLYEIVLKLWDETEQLDLGDVILLTHPRYSLATGARFLVIGVEPDAAAGTLTLLIWGTEDPGVAAMHVAPILVGAGTVT